MKDDVMTKEYLEKLPADALVAICLQNLEMMRMMSTQLAALQAQNTEYMKKIDALQENMAVLVQQRFGRKTEKYAVDPNQTCFELGPVLNEAEELTEGGIEEEPEEVITVRGRRQKASGLRISASLKKRSQNSMR